MAAATKKIAVHFLTFKLTTINDTETASWGFFYECFYDTNEIRCCFLTPITTLFSHASCSPFVAKHSSRENSRFQCQHLMHWPTQCSVSISGCLCLRVEVLCKFIMAFMTASPFLSPPTTTTWNQSSINRAQPKITRKWFEETAKIFRLSVQGDAWNQFLS